MIKKESGPAPYVVYEFGEFRLDAARRLLYARGRSTALAIKPKVLDTLLYFVEYPGELLDKDRLLAALWPGVIVEENGLTQVVSSLRNVLGETPGDNRYLATVPGRGYRFVADVVRATDRPTGLQESATAEPAAQPATEPALHPARHPQRRPALMALLALAVVLGAGLIIYGGSARWRAAREAAMPAPSPATTALPASTVAVLPFENLSADAGDAYFAFGLAESILHRLASIPGLTLIARTSSFAVGEHPADVQEIARKLNARYLVEGSVQRSGERLRVTAQLIDATSGGHLWSLRFDRTLDDIFVVEDEISQSIATALDVSLNREQHPQASFGTDAYLAYLQGRGLLATTRVEDAERAMEHFQRAIEIAPNFAAAYAALADAHWQVALNQQTSGTGFTYLAITDRQRQRLAAGVREAQPLLDQALQLDDSLAEAYVLRGDLKDFMDDVAGAESDYRKGLSLSPSYGAGHERLGLLYWRVDDPDNDPLHEVDKAIRVDPLSPRNYFVRGNMHLGNEEGGVYSEAESNFQQALARAPDYHPALLFLGVIRWYQGRFAEAVMLAERALAIDPRAEWIRRPLAEVYLEVDEVDAARSVLLEAPEAVPPIEWQAVCLYARRPERGAALRRAEPEDWADAVYTSDVLIYQLRDTALANGRFASGRDELLALQVPATPDAEDPWVMASLAQLTLALGERQEAERLARKLLEHQRKEGYYFGYQMAYPRATAHAVLAQNDAALDLLEEGFARGYRKRWWYAFRRDPAFEPLRGDPRFRALAARAEAHAAAERESLQRMRERGQVPKRTMAETGKRGPC